jgi:hypothetical protein
MSENIQYSIDYHKGYILSVTDFLISEGVNFSKLSESSLDELVGELLEAGIFDGLNSQLLVENLDHFNFNDNLLLEGFWGGLLGQKRGEDLGTAAGRVTRNVGSKIGGAIGSGARMVGRNIGGFAGALAGNNTFSAQSGKNSRNIGRAVGDKVRGFAGDFGKNFMAGKSAGEHVGGLARGAVKGGVNLMKKGWDAAKQKISSMRAPAPAAAPAPVAAPQAAASRGTSAAGKLAAMQQRNQVRADNQKILRGINRAKKKSSANPAAAAPAQMSAENASTDFSALMASRLFTRITEAKKPPKIYGQHGTMEEILAKIQAGVGSPTKPTPKPSKREDSSTNLKDRMVEALAQKLTESPMEFTYGRETPEQKAKNAERLKQLRAKKPKKPSKESNPEAGGGEGTEPGSYFTNRHGGRTEN